MLSIRDLSFMYEMEFLYISFPRADVYCVVQLNISDILYDLSHSCGSGSDFFYRIWIGVFERPDPDADFVFIPCSESKISLKPVVIKAFKVLNI